VNLETKNSYRVNVDFFIRFVNLLLNDVTFVLDESFTSFTKIHDLSDELRRADHMEEAVRKEKEEALENAKRMAKSYMGLTNQTVSMLKLFTETLADAFTMPEIVQRLADMLDYNLDALVGPRQKNLKVDNPQEYGFDAKTMVSEIIDVYLNLKDKPRFHTAVARDGRSYKPSNFSQASAIMSRFALKSPEQMTAWEGLAKEIALTKEAEEQAEEDYGEVPDEFLDPLIYTIMEDPVILPTSKTVIDRSTIRSHLLSDPIDPFNRQPLKIEDVIPATDLKERIEKFKEEKRRGRLEALKAADEDKTESMDTSA
jgi:ubiquitin conjugation factor E4 B